ncbi:hypothetical protein X947_5749 [Burkholderia pseudomallei MSHR7334]|nr:hypothetical protein X947_5749 [Burkholderia pseudomallei MSHR7334]
MNLFLRRSPFPVCRVERCASRAHPGSRGTRLSGRRTPGGAWCVEGAGRRGMRARAHRQEARACYEPI